MYEIPASGQGKNCLKALEGTILGAYTRMGIVPIPHQPDDNNNNDNNKKTSKFLTIEVLLHNCQHSYVYIKIYMHTTFSVISKDFGMERMQVLILNLLSWSKIKSHYIFKMNT